MRSFKTYVWSFLGRLTHWILAISFILSYISSFYEQLLEAHIALGIMTFFMLLMKILWGLIGPKYARWSDFHFSFSDLKFYFVEKIKNRYRDISAGHNPASSWFAFLFTWIGIICCISGLILYGIQEGNGIFSYLNEKYYIYMNLYENIHIILVYILLFMIAVHITGVFIEHFYHKTNMIMAMVSGYKKAKGIDIQTTLTMNLLGSLYIVLSIMFSSYIYFNEDNVFVKSKFEKIDYKSLHKDFHFECSDCHNLIPPNLLPRDSWVELMKNQKNHYEEDLELESSMIDSIENFLVDNSAENSTQEVSYKLQREIQNSKNFTITKTMYWKNVHKNIPESDFKSDDIERKSNCVACHEDFEAGILSDNKIIYLENK